MPNGKKTKSDRFKVAQRLKYTFTVLYKRMYIFLKIWLYQMQMTNANVVRLYLFLCIDKKKSRALFHPEIALCRYILYQKTNFFCSHFLFPYISLRSLRNSKRKKRRHTHTQNKKSYIYINRRNVQGGGGGGGCCVPSHELYAFAWKNLFARRSELCRSCVLQKKKRFFF